MLYDFSNPEHAMTPQFPRVGSPFYDEVGASETHGAAGSAGYSNGSEMFLVGMLTLVVCAIITGLLLSRPE